jgi:Fe-S-cluster containining protein
LTRLYQIQEEIRGRVEAIASSHEYWPCRRGCDECCRRLAAAPRVARAEWERIAGAIERLPVDAADAARHRIRESAGASRPVVCPLLAVDTGSCLIYEARPLACRAYGFYAERQYVLGCSRIEAIAEQSPNVVWGNHVTLEERASELGQAVELSLWLEAL